MAEKKDDVKNEELGIYDVDEKTVTPAEFKRTIVHDSLSSFPEKIITDDSARLFNIVGTVFILDDSCVRGTDLTQALLKADTVVSITDDTGRVIGNANIFVSDNKVLAEGSIDYATPERLCIQNGEHLSFKSLGHIEVANGGPGQLGKGTAIYFKSIMLHVSPSEDARIPPVQEVE